MGLITIPSDYVEGHSRIVPIVIRDADDFGSPIAAGWIEGAIRAANGIRRLALRVLFDEWRASELADETVQDLAAEHGANVGRAPHTQIYVHAKWKAYDKRAGGWRARRGMETELLENTLAVLADPANIAEQVERSEIVARVKARLSIFGLVEARELLDLALHDGDFEFGSEIGESANTVSRRFWRSIRKAARGL